MKRVLRNIEDDTLHDVVDPGNEFPVSPAFEWVDINSSEVSEMKGGEFSKWNGGNPIHSSPRLPTPAEQRLEILNPLRSKAMEAVLAYIDQQPDCPAAIKVYMTALANNPEPRD